MNRPLVSIVLAYAAGLLLAEFFHSAPTALLAVSSFVLLLTVSLPKLRSGFLWPLLALIGWSNYSVRTAAISPHDLRTQIGTEPALVTVRGELLETPRQMVYEREGEKVWRSLATVRVQSCQRLKQNSAAPAHGDILTTTPGVLGTNIFAGQTVEISGVLGQPPRPVAEGLFDYQSYLAGRGIFYQLDVETTNDWKVISPIAKPTPWGDRFLNWAQAALAYGLPAPDEPLELLWAMTLGWRPALTDEVSAPFMKSGTMHIFAISGLHIALIAGILMAVLRTMQLPRFWCGLVVIPIIWFYTAATGWQPSAIRSTIMMSLVIGGWMLRRPGNLLNSLAAAALIILVWDPAQLFQASFQLSFFVVLSIALFMPPLEKIRDRLLQIDPLLPRELLPRWQRWSYPVARLLLTWLAVSLAAWFGSWPLTAYYFHIFSPVTLLANLIIVPLSSAALAANLGSLVCGDWLPWGTELFNHSAWFWMWCMVAVSEWLVQLPHAFFYVASPGVMDFVIYFTTLIAVTSGLVFRQGWRVAAAIWLVAAIGFYGWRIFDARNITTLTALPLNGGSAVFVRDGKAGDLMIDCGATNSVKFITQPFLQSQGVNRLPQLILTQGDIRDMGGVGLIDDTFPVEQILASAVKFRSSAYRKTVNDAEAFPKVKRTLQPEDSIGDWQVLYPYPTNNFSQADDNSLVLKGEIRGLKILLLSDLGLTGQRDLVGRESDLTADIVFTGLPERSEPLGNRLLEKIKPRLIVVMDSKLPATKRSSRSLRERLEQKEIPVIYTRNAGAVTVVIRPDQWDLRTMDGQKFSSANATNSPPHAAPVE